MKTPNSTASHFGITTRIGGFWPMSNTLFGRDLGIIYTNITTR